MNNNNSYIMIDYQQINPNDILNERFDFDQGIREGRLCLESYEDERVQKISANFEEDIWLFKELYSRNIVAFKFNEIDNVKTLKNMHDIKKLKIVIKCWIAAELNLNSINIVQQKLSNVKIAMHMSNSFSSLEEMYKKLSSFQMAGKWGTKHWRIETVSDAVVERFIIDLIGFIKFYNLSELNLSIDRLRNIQKQLSVSSNMRKLPSFKDILSIKYFLDKWYKEAKSKGELEILKYYPLIIWWDLTSIIPMRVVEFLHIKRESVYMKNQKYYIMFPRMKHNRIGENRTKTNYDQLPISLELYKMINEYIKMSDQYGQSNYLISFQAFRSSFNLSITQENKDNMFNRSDLHYVLSRFFKDILHYKYMINIQNVNNTYRYIYSMKVSEKSLLTENSNGSVDTLINPGDLRHLAIINMMMQGYDKVEIQRLAGHFTEEMQFNYYSHAESWLEVEILKMEREYSNYLSIERSSVDTSCQYHPKTQLFIEKQRKRNYINKTKLNESEEFIKLELGMCTDETMPCPAFNWGNRGCYFCCYWMISEEELINKKEIIINDLEMYYSETRKKIKLLYQTFQSDLDGQDDKQIQNRKVKLMALSKELQIEIKQIAKIQQMLGGNVNE